MDTTRNQALRDLIYSVVQLDHISLSGISTLDNESFVQQHHNGSSPDAGLHKILDVRQRLEQSNAVMAGGLTRDVNVPYFKKSWAVARELIKICLTKPDRKGDENSTYERTRHTAKNMCLSLNKAAFETEKFVGDVSLTKQPRKHCR